MDSLRWAQTGVYAKLQPALLSAEHYPGLPVKLHSNPTTICLSTAHFQAVFIQRVRTRAHCRTVADEFRVDVTTTDLTATLVASLHGKQRWHDQITCLCMFPPRWQIAAPSIHLYADSCGHAITDMHGAC